jgi:plasmid stabilization system protein ParE
VARKGESEKYVVEITAAAEDDLREIHAYIKRDRPLAADKLIVAIERQVTKLEQNPLRGVVIEEARLLGLDYRHLLHGPYRTIYRVGRGRVWIVRVVHGARLIGHDDFDGG